MNTKWSFKLLDKPSYSLILGIPNYPNPSNSFLAFHLAPHERKDLQADANAATEWASPLGFLADFGFATARFRLPKVGPTHFPGRFVVVRGRTPAPTDTIHPAGLGGCSDRFQILG